MKMPAASLAPILRSDVQGRILARLMADPDKGYNLSELVAITKSSMPTVQREVGRAQDSGIVTTEKVGPTRIARVNAAHPLYSALRQIVLATYGAPATINKEFSELEGAHAVVIFGSWAARYIGEAGQAPNDIDVLVIGAPNRDAVDAAADRAEASIGVPVQATVRSLDQWHNRNDNFIQEVKSRALVVVLADETISSDLGDLKNIERFTS